MTAPALTVPVAVESPIINSPFDEPVLLELWHSSDRRQRPGEVVGLAWHEIDADAWTIPAALAKSSRAHRVPLSALDLFSEARDVSGDPAYAFPSPRGTDDRPMDRHSLSRAVAHNLAVHVVVHVERTADCIRIVSFRKANRREVRFHEQHTQP